MRIARILYQSVVWRGLFYLSSFVLNILIARHFEAAVSGSIYYLIYIFSLLHLVGSLSLDSGFIYFASKKEIPASRLLTFSVVWTLACGFFLGLVLGSGTFNSSYSGIGPGMLASFCIFFVCGNLLLNYATGLFHARNQFIIPGVIGVAHNSLLILIMPFEGSRLITAITDANYFYYYFLAFLSQGLCVALVFKVKNPEGLTFKFPSAPDLKKLFKYSLLALAGNLAFFFLYRVDYWFVEKYCSAEQLGNYIQVSRIGQLFFLLPSFLAAAIFPLTAADQNQLLPARLALISRTFLFFYAAACLVLAVIGRWFFPFVFGETFGAMYSAFLWLVPGILSLSTLFSLTAYNGGINKLKENMTGCLLALCFVVPANWWLVPIYGINAAAAVSSVGYILYEVYLLYLFKKENEARLSSFFIFRKDDLAYLKNMFTHSKG